MMRRDKHIALGLVVLLLSQLLLNGCLVGNEPVGTDAGQGLNLVVAGRLTICASAADASSLVDWQDGQPSGFEYELMQVMAERMGLELDYVQPSPTSIEGIGDAVRPHDAEATVLTQRYLSPSESHDTPDVYWSDPYYVPNWVCLVRASSETEELSDLSGKVVGVMNPEELGGAWDTLLPESAAIKPIIGFTDSLAALQAGFIDALLMPQEDTNDRYRFFERYPNLRPIGVVPTGEQYVLLFPSGNQALLAAVNDTLQGVVGDGTYATIHTRHFSYGPTLPLQVRPYQERSGFEELERYVTEDLGHPEYLSGIANARASQPDLTLDETQRRKAGLESQAIADEAISEGRDLTDDELGRLQELVLIQFGCSSVEELRDLCEQAHREANPAPAQSTLDIEKVKEYSE